MRTQFENQVRAHKYDQRNTDGGSINICWARHSSWQTLNAKLDVFPSLLVRKGCCTVGVEFTRKI